MKTEHRVIQIYTDGSCSDTGSGGWACIVRSKHRMYEMYGGDIHTTSMRMEMTAVIRGLWSLAGSQNVEIYTDCQDIVDVVTSRKLDSWQASGWILSDNLIKSNADLWEELHRLVHRHNVSMFWIKGHSGHPYNARCDKLARSQMKLRKDTISL